MVRGINFEHCRTNKMSTCFICFHTVLCALRPKSTSTRALVLYFSPPKCRSQSPSQWSGCSSSTAHHSDDDPVQTKIACLGDGVMSEQGRGGGDMNRVMKKIQFILFDNVYHPVR